MVADLVLLALMGVSKELLVLILVLDVFPQLLHFKDKSHKLLVMLLTFCNYTPTALVSKNEKNTYHVLTVVMGKVVATLYTHS